MNQERKEELIVRWMDAEQLSAEENQQLEAILAAEPELKTLRNGHHSMREELQSVYGQPRDLPYGDFFQSKLEQAIRDSELEFAEASKASFNWRDTLRWWVAPVTVGAMAIAFLAGTRVGTAPVEERLVVAEAQIRPLVYTPEGGVTSTIVNADAAGTSVIVLEGLQPIPDSYDLMAERKSSSDRAATVKLLSRISSSQIF